MGMNPAGVYPGVLDELGYYLLAGAGGEGGVVGIGGSGGGGAAIVGGDEGDGGGGGGALGATSGGDVGACCSDPSRETRAARGGIDERARLPRRLLEESTEAAHSFHPV